MYKDVQHVEGGEEQSLEVFSRGIMVPKTRGATSTPSHLPQPPPLKVQGEEHQGSPVKVLPKY